MDAEMKARELLAEEVARMEKTWEICDYAEEYEKAAIRAIRRALSPPASAAVVSEADDPVVGHKTFDNGMGGFRHEPLRRSEADVLIAHCKLEDERRKALMPDERSAIRMMMDAHTRLKEMGWNDAIYCPKDGSVFEVIEPGSTGIFPCTYEGEWPRGSWWIQQDGGCPSRPVLFRPIAATPSPPVGEKGEG